MKYLYLVKLSEKVNSWDYVNEAVVCAVDEKESKRIFKTCQFEDSKLLDTKVTLIGVAESNVPNGIVSASIVYG